MSEEKERDLVTGVIEGVTQKRPDTWQVAVKPDGSKYTKNLWTKDSELVDALTAKLGEHGAFVCNVSYWENSAGKQIRSLWISGETDEEAPEPQKAPKRDVVPAAAAKDVDWDAKERRDYRSRAWAQAISATQHQGKADESAGDLYRRVYALQRMIYRDIVRDLDPDAYPDDDVPF